MGDGSLLAFVLLGCLWVTDSSASPLLEGDMWLGGLLDGSCGDDWVDMVESSFAARPCVVQCLLISLMSSLISSRRV